MPQRECFYSVSTIISFRKGLEVALTQANSGQNANVQLPQYNFKKMGRHFPKFFWGHAALH